MSQFEDFVETYGPAQNCEPPAEGDLRAYEGTLPPELLQHWREAGWCAYGNQLLWIVNPKQFDGVVDEWLEFEPGTSSVFMRSAFAHLYLWHDGYVHSLDVQDGNLSRVTKNIARMFTLLTDPELQEKILRRSLYEQVLPRLGPLGRDECYAFEPALALGGPGTPDTVRRVKIREHLGILKQIVIGE
jgi:hypothetical protein